MTNKERIKRVKEALKVYGDNYDEAQHITELYADTMHLCDELGVNPTILWDSAFTQFIIEQHEKKERDSE